MQPINLQILFADGTSVDASTMASDYIAFETHFDKPITALSTDMRMTYMFYLAWHCVKRTKKTDLPFEEWCDTVSMVGEADEKKA